MSVSATAAEISINSKKPAVTQNMQLVHIYFDETTTNFVPPAPTPDNNNVHFITVNMQTLLNTYFNEFHLFRKQLIHTFFTNEHYLGGSLAKIYEHPIACVHLMRLAWEQMWVDLQQLTKQQQPADPPKRVAVLFQLWPPAFCSHDGYLMRTALTEIGWSPKFHTGHTLLQKQFGWPGFNDSEGSTFFSSNDDIAKKYHAFWEMIPQLRTLSLETPLEACVKQANLLRSLKQPQVMTTKLVFGYLYNAHLLKTGFENNNNCPRTIQLLAINGGGSVNEKDIIDNNDSLVVLDETNNNKIKSVLVYRGADVSALSMTSRKQYQNALKSIFISS